ncbi:hypothetical protein [Rosenbergiella collisarenosi]|nr:hypothetical protein [Rosenbergiella collisarenosi]
MTRFISPFIDLDKGYGVFLATLLANRALSSQQVAIGDKEPRISLLATQ